MHKKWFVRWRPWGAATATVLLFGFGACTVILDRDSVQCKTDGDCAAFGSARCESGVCVAASTSTLAPPGCFAGTPQKEAEFLNHCTTSTWEQIGTCDHNVCSGTVDVTSDALRPDAGSTGAGGSTPPAGDAGAPPALPNCYDPSAGRSQVVFITGSSNIPPLIGKLAPLLAEASAGGYTPVYRVTSSCDGVRSMLGEAPGDRTIHDPAPAPNAAYATYFTADGVAVPCSLGPDGVTVDVGESDIFSTTCSSAYLDQNESVEHVLGPIQAMVFVVPGVSTQKSISAETAFAVFGRGGKNATSDAVSPWDTPTLYYVRNANTGTQQMIGRAIRLGADQFWGVDRKTAKTVADTLPLLDPTRAEKAIGIISVDYYDANRSNLKALAFQAVDQQYAYLPDSSPFASDKRNVRDGHYPIWGPLHFFAAASNGVPTSAAALAFLSIVAGNVGTESVSERLLDAYIGASLVPNCAMMVKRDAELGPLSALAPRGQCGCYFEKKVTGKAPAECSVCMTSEDCTNKGRPFCSHGFCEAQ